MIHVVESERTFSIITFFLMALNNIEILRGGLKPKCKQ